jgi:hypothetical protein
LLIDPKIAGLPEMRSEALNIPRKLAIVFVLLSAMAANADLIITDIGVTVGNVDQSGANDSDGGAVILDATSGDLVAGDITTNGGFDGADAQGHDAGNVTLSGQNINFGAISALGSAAQTGTNPDGADGDVLVTANGSVVVGGNIDAGQIDIFIEADEATTDGAESLEIQGTLTAATINLDGGAVTQNDTLIVSLTGADTATWQVNGTNAGSLTAGTSNAATFTNFSDLQGGDQDDTFEIMGYVASISGGAGNDTIIGDAANANTFVINAADAGTANSIAFSGVENLAGGAVGDSFTFSAALSGTASGGAGDDTFAINDGGSAGAIDGGAGNDEVTFAGSTGPVTASIGSFTDIETLTGSANAADTLRGTSSGDKFTLSGVDSGTAGGINFSSFENLDGLGGADTYVFSSSSFLTGSIGFDNLDALLLFGIFSADLGLSAGDDLFDLGFLSFDSSSLFFRSSVLDDFGFLTGLSGFNGTLASDSFDPYRVMAVPEPGTLGLLGIGLAALSLTRRRRPV